MKKILIVDDDPGFRKLLSTLIRRAGYEVEEAKEGAEAVAAINKMFRILWCLILSCLLWGDMRSSII